MLRIKPRKQIKAHLNKVESVNRLSAFGGLARLPIGNCDQSFFLF
jgi:hypothetical protein